MADDLVQRLRNGRLCRCLEAACEIERLRAEVATIRESRTVAERELAALRERIEKAPVAETWETDWGGRAPNSLVADVPAAIGEGKRVRLVREDDT